jgi:hypothetical protein
MISGLAHGGTSDPDLEVVSEDANRKPLRTALLACWSSATMARPQTTFSATESLRNV